MARAKRDKIGVIGVSLDKETVGELSERSDALNRAISEIACEIILSDPPRFKNRNRKELKAHSNQIRNEL